MDTTSTFADLCLPLPLLETVEKLGFSAPTAIQMQAIPPLLAGRDVIGVAQTGTGKTAAFGLPLLTQIDSELKNVQALVLAPTRELAIQDAEAISNFAIHNADIEVATIYGGAPYGPQLQALRKGAQIVVGAPGRIIDLYERGALVLDSVKYFVLDEADEMLHMGFAEDVDKIAAALPAERISALFSATMPKQIRAIAAQHLQDPIEITVTPPASVVETIEQEYAVVAERYKVGALCRVLATTEAPAALVFVHTRATAEQLALELTARGVHAATLSGDVAQVERERLVERLRSGFLNVLVATDVAARGLDVERIGLVVNFDIPREAATYVHRIGRTGRAGRRGHALTFVTPKQRFRLRRIEKITGVAIKEAKLPTASEVNSIRAREVLAQAQQRQEKGNLDLYATALAKWQAEQVKQSEDTANRVNDESSESSANLENTESPINTINTETPLNNEARQELNFSADLLLALLALAVQDDGEKTSIEPEDLAASFTAEKKSRKARKRRTEPKAPTFSGKGTVYRVEVGRRDGISPGSIVGAITGESNVKGSELGRIDIFPSFSLVEMKHELDNKTRKRIGQARLAGRALNISRDNGPRKQQKSAGATDSLELRKYRADKKFGEERRKARQQAQEKAQQRKKKGKKSRH
ncbi:DEAD/DEAH box helicase [uncultured Arcanobacterium sp.]|uniref:DEAD/DEAH box helicase n=1 Tax=uncultured Arcanobacterium sp. TaxID=487520 RepID=UPI002637EE5D|nr:DEAD/DEAH box helicase [uncultured Arcanobacterium sp.]